MGYELALTENVRFNMETLWASWILTPKGHFLVPVMLPVMGMAAHIMTYIHDRSRIFIDRLTLPYLSHLAITDQPLSESGQT